MLFEIEPNIIIAGGRDFSDYELLKQSMSEHFPELVENTNTKVISGCARGADSLGIKWANEFNKYTYLYPAEWERFGKRAGFMRNVEMSLIGNYLLAFWDGKSKGTKHMIEQSEKCNLKIKIVKYK